ncbi:hypothetical protein [Microseira sp. BLCC-F43]
MVVELLLRELIAQPLKVDAPASSSSIAMLTVWNYTFWLGD